MTQTELARCPSQPLRSGLAIAAKARSARDSIGFGPCVVHGLSQAVESDDNSEVVALQDQTPQENGLKG